MKNKALVLFSGGLDSSTTLMLARQTFECKAVTYYYGQRHICEITYAKRQADDQKTELILNNLSIPRTHSSLLNKDLVLGKPSSVTKNKRIPNTFVPGRNLLFLVQAFVDYYPTYKNFFIGVNVIDYSEYPDCRPEFIRSLQEALRYSVQDGKVYIRTPIISRSKRDIVLIAKQNNVNLKLTWSCYDPQETSEKPFYLACGTCPSCKIRLNAFKELGMEDPLKYLGTNLDVKA